MTVKDIFDLRKQGRIEEAYEAIRPMYAVHKGKYTTLCMFWTAHDILKKRVGEKRTDEALKIFKALMRVLPNIDDADGKARTSMICGALMLSRNTNDFSILDFLSQIPAEQLTSEDWRPLTTTPVNGRPSHTIPSVAQRLLDAAFREIKDNPTVDNALKVMPLLQENMRRNPNNKQGRQYMEVVKDIIRKHSDAD